jgi:hypothetical protein
MVPAISNEIAGRALSRMRRFFLGSFPLPESSSVVPAKTLTVRLEACYCLFHATDVPNWTCPSPMYVRHYQLEIYANIGIGRGKTNNCSPQF